MGGGTTRQGVGIWALRKWKGKKKVGIRRCERDITDRRVKKDKEKKKKKGRRGFGWDGMYDE
jgi:hypothetical protein